MKPLIATVVASCMLAAAFAQQPASSPASLSAQTQAASKPVGKDLKVLCSVFPAYLFTKTVAAGSNLHVDLMLPANLGCPHDYALTPQDMRKIAAADLLVVNGQGLEEFLGEPVKKANSRIRVIDSSAGIKDLIQMRGENEHQEKEGKDADHREEGRRHHSGTNPHLFASPLMAARMAANIATELAKADPENAALYARNAKGFAGRMEKLAGECTQAAKALASRKIVTEHAVFDYLARDCGLEVVAVVEEAPGQAPSAAETLDIVRKIKDSGAAAVFTEPQYPARIGQTIAREARLPVAVLDPVASGPTDAGMDYYEKVMRANLDTLKKVLGDKGK